MRTLGERELGKFEFECGRGGKGFDGLELRGEEGRGDGNGRNYDEIEEERRRREDRSKWKLDWTVQSLEEGNWVDSNWWYLRIFATIQSAFDVDSDREIRRTFENLFSFPRIVFFLIPIVPVANQFVADLFQLIELSWDWFPLYRVNGRGRRLSRN